MHIVTFILGFLMLLFGVLSTIGLAKESVREFKKEELRIMIYTIFITITISIGCAGLDTILYSIK